MQVSVSAQKISVPHQCACCGAFADKELLVSTTRTTGKKVVKTKTRGWSFPYCSSCLQHVSIANSSSIALIGIGAGIIISVLFLCILPQLGILGFLLGLTIAIPAIYVQRQENRYNQSKLTKLLSSNCATHKEAVTYLGWQGSVHTFEFSSQSYAMAFMQANRSKLINISPEALRMLDSPSSNNVLVSGDSSGQSVAPSLDSTTDTRRSRIVSWLQQWPEVSVKMTLLHPAVDTFVFGEAVTYMTNLLNCSIPNTSQVLAIPPTSDKEVLMLLGQVLGWLQQWPDREQDLYSVCPHISQEVTNAFGYMASCLAEELDAFVEVRLIEKNETPPNT